MRRILIDIFAQQNMDSAYTYQQDTLQLKSLSKSVPESNQLTIERKPVSGMDISERKQVEPEEAVPPGPKKYTPQQIRYWRNQQENKLLVDSSRYIRPRSELELTSTKTTEQKIVLPIREKLTTGTDWLTVVLFSCILLFATIRYSYIKYIKHLFTALVNYPTSIRLLQESSYPSSHVTYRLDVVFYLAFSIFIYQVLNIFELANASNKFTFFLIVLAAVLVYFTVKKFLYKVVGIMFETNAETNEYVFNLNNSNRTLGLSLLPLVALISFSPMQTPVYVLFAGIIVVILFQLVLLLRGIFILMRKQFSIFYLFLYLCTLEFLPLLLIYKIVVVE